MQGALVRGHARPGTRLTLDGHDVPVAADGTFVLGFDRDAPATMRVAEHFTGPAGTPLVVTTALTVAPRAWRIERLNTLPRMKKVPPTTSSKKFPASWSCNFHLAFSGLRRCTPHLFRCGPSVPTNGSISIAKAALHHHDAGLLF